MAGALPKACFLPDFTFYETPIGYLIGQPLVFADQGDHFIGGAKIKDASGTGSLQVPRWPGDQRK